MSEILRSPEHVRSARLATAPRSPATRRPTDFLKMCYNGLFLLNIYMLRRNSKIENYENLDKIRFVYKNHAI